MSAKAQVITGNVYDKTNYVPLPNVLVSSSSGKDTLTDSIGHYAIQIDPNEKDSIWFTYGGKSTKKFSIDTIANPLQFDISIRVISPLKNYLPNVVVTGKKGFSYYYDSLQNRKEYAKIFNPDKGGVRLKNISQGQFGIALDLDAIITAFQFSKNKRKEIYKKWILDEERYNYVKHRFTPSLVAKFTKFSDEELKNFMTIYWPDYYVLREMSDFDLGIYIDQCLKDYNSKKKILKKNKNTNIFAEPE